VLLVVALTAACGQESEYDRRAETEPGFITALDGVPIAYSAYGAGSPALVFVHGWSCDRSYWREQVAHLSREHRLVTVDLAGHGASGAGREDWSIAAFAGDVSAVVEALCPRDVVLIGHSMGGAVVVKAARRLPGRVRALVLVDAYDDFDATSTPEEIEEFLRPFRENLVETVLTGIPAMFFETTDPALVARIAADMSTAPPEVAVASLESAVTAMSGREKTTALRGLEMPVFAINADDGTTDVASMERHGVQLQLVPRVVHFLMLEDPRAFNSALVRVIAVIAD
jgi:pimeloyl-ACP methyl ester carboxylesterase